jgi:hypothetical protein
MLDPIRVGRRWAPVSRCHSGWHRNICEQVVMYVDVCVKPLARFFLFVLRNTLPSAHQLHAKISWGFGVFGGHRYGHELASCEFFIHLFLLLSILGSYLHTDFCVLILLRFLHGLN